MVMAAGFLGIFSKDAIMGSVTKLPVLTLPGIAGILLTIGMAVDANVLIFERIREELGAGKRLWTSITAGYSRAFVTIIDANVTTLLTGIVLFIFGSGPIRGFAVTLCAGIMVSMFTALVVTKLFFRLLVTKTTIKSLKMMSIIKKTSFDFVSLKKVAAVLSLLVILSTCGYMGVRANAKKGDVFGVDFLGGVSTTYEFTKELSPVDFEGEYPVNVLRDALASAGLKELHIQYQREMEAGGDGYLQIKTAIGVKGEARPSKVIDDTLHDAFPAAGFVQIQEDLVGPQVGKELVKQAMWAISLALLMIIAYVSWRFELGFAVGAIVALAHDVLVTVGIYTAMGHQLSLPIVAALLTIVGYSVNDTIVVFDRIREDIRIVRNKTFKEICNLSINQTLSRTLLTSLTTLITVVMLLVFGGGAIHDFALALCIGVIVGTYSSIFVATPLVLTWYKGKKPDFSSK
jgi:SecD/SecF fusion protein